MPLFHIISFFVQVPIAAWLIRQGQGRGRFARALYFLMVFDLARGLLSYAGFLTNAPLILALQLLSWLALSWGLSLDWRLAAIMVGGAAALVLLVPAVPAALLTWGFVAALPLAAAAFRRQQPDTLPSLPLQAQPDAPPAPGKQPVVVEGEQQRSILECLSDGVILSNQDGSITFVNQAALDLVGMSIEEMLGRPVTDILTRLPMLAPTNGSPASKRFEMNGRIIQGQANLIYDDNGVAQGAVATLHDMTAEFQAEQAKDSFLTTISHELRTPLTAIKGYVELLENGTGGPLTETQHMFTQTIQRNVARMVHLINSLIFASSVKAGRQEYRSGHTDFSQLIQQIAREMQPRAAEYGQQIKVDIDSKLQPIQADPTHMATIVEELVSNSIKFNRPGGVIQIKAALDTEPDQDQSFVVVSVSDEGIGIDPADHALIFQDFYRPDRHAVQIRARGMGMGLSIVRSLVEAYYGRIWFESAPDKGSTFTFIIPTQQPKQTPPFRPPVKKGAVTQG
ncbi:MAG: ATP-binding protein [Anaerolineae bacterium]